MSCNVDLSQPPTLSWPGLDMGELWACSSPAHTQVNTLNSVCPLFHDRDAVHHHLLCTVTPLLSSFPTVALRKTETSHHLSLDRTNIPPETFQKSSQLTELPQKPPLGELPPKPVELAPKPQVGELPPKPGELPPKPQLGDLPPKPQLSDLPPKPQMKDLPPKPQLGDLLAKSQAGDVSAKVQPPSEVTQRSHTGDLSPNVQSRDAIQKQASEDSNDLTPTLPETPVPLPRKINTVGGSQCQARPSRLEHFFRGARKWTQSCMCALYSITKQHPQAAIPQGGRRLYAPP